MNVFLARCYSPLWFKLREVSRVNDLVHIESIRDAKIDSIWIQRNHPGLLNAAGELALQQPQRGTNTIVCRFKGNLIDECSGVLRDFDMIGENWANFCNSCHVQEFSFTHAQSISHQIDELAQLARNLIRLDLSRNRIGNVEIAKLIPHCDKLTTLNLAHNVIDNVGLDTILNFLEANKSLANINLDFNNFTIGGIKVFTDKLLQVNFTIVTLLVERGNYIVALSQKEQYDLQTSEEIHQRYKSRIVHVYDAEDYGKIRENCIALCSRNKCLIWDEKLHNQILNVVVAFAPLQLPVYVLLFILDGLPFWEIGVSRYKKVILIEKVVKSIQKINKK